MLRLFPNPQDIANGYTEEPSRAELIAEILRLREALYHADEGCNYMHLYDESEYRDLEGQ